MASLLYPGRGTTINVTSHGQHGGITAADVNTGGPSPPEKKPKSSRTKTIVLWCTIVASLVAVMTWAGVGPSHVVDSVKAFLK